MALITLDWTAQHDADMGRRIASARELKGISLAALARHLNVSKATVGFWETGARTIKHHDLARLCSALEVSADELMFGKRIWPFDGIDAEKIAQLEPEDVQKLQGALLAVAAQLAVDVAASRPAKPSKPIQETNLRAA